VPPASGGRHPQLVILGDEAHAEAGMTPIAMRPRHFSDFPRAKTSRTFSLIRSKSPPRSSATVFSGLAVAAPATAVCALPSDWGKPTIAVDNRVVSVLVVGWRAPEAGQRHPGPIIRPRRSHMVRRTRQLERPDMTPPQPSAATGRPFDAPATPGSPLTRTSSPRGEAWPL